MNDASKPENVAMQVHAKALSEIIGASGHVGYMWDLRADCLIWFGDWQRLFGSARSHAPHNTESFFAAVMDEDRDGVFGGPASPTIDREYRLCLPDGSCIWVHEQGGVEMQDGHPVRQRGLLRLIDAPQKRAGSASEEKRDPLTRQLTRESMLARLDHIMDSGTTNLRGACYLAIGIDKMALLNEAVGAKAGDRLLCCVADRLLETIPAKAVLGRVGGDCFGVLLPAPLGDEMATISKHILDNFHDRPVQIDHHALPVTVSIGAVELETAATDGSEIMVHAEAALRDARLKGRHMMVTYRESEERSNEKRKMLALGDRVKQALKHDGLRLAYQPVLETATGQVLFYEALVRMFDDKGGVIAAADFVPLVEEMGLALELDHRVLDLATAEMERYPDLRLAINISGLTASRADWPQHLQAKLGHKRDVVKRLIIEITETMAITDVEETQRFAEALKAMGGQVALDDFGAGFTSIRHLRSLSLAIMKIDRDLIFNLVDNPEQQHIVRMLIGIAQGLGLKTVAEGVETEGVANWLRTEKVDMLQGYYFGKPSLDPPWLSLKHAEAPPAKAQATITSIFGDVTAPPVARVAAVTQTPATTHGKVQG